MVAHWLLEKKTLQAETFIGFMVLFAQLIPPAKGFSNAFYNIRKGLASAQRIFEILDAPVLIEEKPDARPIQNFANEIVYNKVGFSYHNFDDKKILEELNLSIAKRQIDSAGGPKRCRKKPRWWTSCQGSMM
jgi:subfamily B ATP-binding cassette protein MsbA